MSWFQISIFWLNDWKGIFLFPFIKTDTKRYIKFKKSEQNIFFTIFSKTIASSLHKVGSLSIQAKLLELFKVYMDDKLDRRHHGILDLFDGLLEDTNPFFRLFEKYTTLDDNRKKRLLYRDLPNIINRKGKRVDSKIMRFLYFDGSSTTPYPVSIFGTRIWIYFHRLIDAIFLFLVIRSLGWF